MSSRSHGKQIHKPTNLVTFFALFSVSHLSGILVHKEKTTELGPFFSRVLLLNISFPTFYWSEELKEIKYEVLNVRNRNFANLDWLSSVVQENVGCVRGNQSRADRAVCLLRAVFLEDLHIAYLVLH